jgi:hypothetical protein
MSHSRYVFLHVQGSKLIGYFHCGVLSTPCDSVPPIPNKLQTSTNYGIGYWAPRITCCCRVVPVPVLLLQSFEKLQYTVKIRDRIVSIHRYFGDFLKKRLAFAFTHLQWAYLIMWDCCRERSQEHFFRFSPQGTYMHNTYILSLEREKTLIKTISLFTHCITYKNPCLYSQLLLVH